MSISIAGILVLSHLASIDAHAEDESEPQREDADVAASNIRWTGSELGFELLAELPQDLIYTVEAEVRLGALRAEWSQSPLVVGVDGTLRVTINAPTIAFLDDLADDYVTDLHVVVSGNDSAGRTQIVVTAPHTVLVWPDGRGAPAVVWDIHTMQSLAPAGGTPSIHG